MEKIHIIIKLSKIHFLTRITSKYNKKNCLKGKKINMQLKIKIK
jgi:hypothetical protein